MSTRHLAFTLAVLTLPCVAAAQENPPAPASPTPPSNVSSVAVEGAAPAANSVSRDKDTLSVDFPDEDIKTILRNVADLFELNLVIPDTLTGKTSIKLRDVTWRQIFAVVLTPVGYTYVEEGNIIKVVSNESLTQEPVTTEVFILNNAKAADIKPTVEGLVDANAGGKILIDSRSNALVVTERPTRMTRMREIIEKLDKATDQVMIESKFVEVSDSDIRNIGVNWASLQGMSLGVTNISQQFSRTHGQQRSNGTTASDTTSNRVENQTVNQNNTLSSQSNTTEARDTTTTSTNYVTSPTNINLANGGFATGVLNLPDGTVTGVPGSVPATVSVPNFTPAQGTTPASFVAPVSYGRDTVNGTTSGTTNTTDSQVRNVSTTTNVAEQAVQNLVGLTNFADTSRIASAVFSASDFNVIISALKQQNNTKIVSNPTIVTLNNTEANLNIGREYPIPSYTYNTERGTFEVSGFQYKPIGVNLKVTPQVNAQGLIRLNLEPEVSSSNENTSFGGAGGATIPIVTTRKVRTQVSLQSGYTAGIGGLINESIQHGGTKVPVLGSIPVLGRLFSSKAVNDTTSNLLIFITARTVTADGATPDQVFTQSSLDAVGYTPVAPPPPAKKR